MKRDLSLMTGGSRLRASMTCAEGEFQANPKWLQAVFAEKRYQTCMGMSLTRKGEGGWIWKAPRGLAAPIDCLHKPVKKTPHLLCHLTLMIPGEVSLHFCDILLGKHKVVLL